MTSTAAPVAILYVRVSTGRQVDEGHSLAEQSRRLEAEAARLGYVTEVVVDEGRSGGKVSNRPGLVSALERLDRGEASALLVLDIDRLSRSTADTARILERSRRKGWRLVIVGLGGIDTASPEGELLVGVMSAAARYEAAMTSARVKRQHEARRQRGIVWGVDEGDRSNLPEEVRAEIVTLRAQGQSLRYIADALNTSGTPTAKGGTWHASTVRHILASPATAALVAAS